ncbi:cytochrome P450 [Streptomyces sp. NBC_00838]|uniref:cytochrome P450 n=1 Tax=Streptomyces sp. NBC_00838 TaxID=2903680 RepID=UPI00386CFFEB|nr:cytochrome P450 [Streptomyces sp. NBC_00838]
MPPAVIPTREQPERWPVAEKTDLLAPEVLADPHRYYRELLEMGPAVWLPVHGVLAVLSDAEIRTVLKDEERFPGVGATPPGDIGAKLWARTVLSIGQQPVAQSGRSPRPAAVDVGQWMDAHAAEVVDECVGEREFGAVALARRFIAGVVMRLTGARGTAEIEAKPTAAAHKAGWTGPGSSLLGAAAPRATAMTTHLCETVSRENVTEGSWLDTLYREADRGRIGHGAVVRLAAECATTGMDTAIHGICTALDTLATRQDLWADLRRRHIRGVDVVREALRLDPLVPGVARLAARDTHIGGIPVRAKDPVWLSHLAAGIDPAKWGQNAHQFIVPRARNSDYLAFGTDPFSQVGQTLAERAADLLLTHLAFRCTRLEPAGAPERDLSTPARSWASLPVRITPHRGRVGGPRAVTTTGGATATARGRGTGRAAT